MSIYTNAPPFWETSGGPITERMNAHKRAATIEFLKWRLLRLVSLIDANGKHASQQAYRRKKKQVEQALERLGARVPDFKGDTSGSCGVADVPEYELPEGVEL